MNDEITTTINQVTKALEALHNPLSNVQTLQQSQQFLEEVKVRPNAYSYALVILTHPNEIVRHYGLHIIENLVKNQWVNASENDKQSVKNEILGFISRVQPNEQKFIKEKMVTVVVEIVKRDWPQRWANLLDSLVQISGLGDTQAEIVLLTLGQLPHEIIFDSTSNNMIALSEQRKKDLMMGINQAITSLFSYFYTMLEKHYTHYQNKPDDRININLVSTLLSTLLSYVEWVPIKLILQHKFDFIFCQLLRDVPFRVKATEALLLFLSRRGRPDERADFLTMFNMIDRVTDAMAVNTANHEVDYAFHKRVAQTLTVLGANHLDQSAKDKLPPNYHIYLQLMLQMLSHPSILLTSLALPFWSSFLKSNETLEQMQFLDQLLIELLTTSNTKLLRVGDPNKGDETPQSKYSAIDFGTNREWSQFYGTVRGRFMEIIKQITIIKPVLTFKYTIKIIRDIITSIQEKPTAPITHEQTMLLESNSFFLELVVQNLPQNFFSDPTNASCIQESESLLKLLLELSFTDPNSTAFQIDCIRPFTTYYNSHPESIQYLLTKLVPMIPFKTVNDQVGRLTNNTLHCRRRIISCLINLATSLPERMLPYLPQLYSSIQQLVSANLVIETERVMLYHLLIQLNNHVTNFQQSLDFIREIITPLLTIWSSPEVTAAFQSPESLLSYLALFEPSNSIKVEEVFPRRKKLQLVVASLQILWKKTALPPTVSEDNGFIPFIAHGISYNTKWPISNFAKDVMPNIFALTKSLHGLWNPALIARVAPEYNAIFHLDEAITAPLLGQEYHKDNKTESENIKFVRNLFDTLRDACYEIIGYGFSHADELFSIATLPKFLIDSVFSSLEFCENRHMKLIIRHLLVHMVKYCPQKLQPQYFDALLPSLLSLYFNRIKSGWEAINARSQKENKDESEISEIIDDKILRDLTLEYVQWVKDFTSHQTILKNQDIVTPLVYGLSACIMSNDHLAVSKATPICVALIDEVYEDSRYHSLIGTDMLRIILNLLMQTKVQDFNADYVSIIRAIYVKLAKRCPFPNQVLATLPNFNQTVLSKLDQDITNSKTEKQQKAIIKKLLDELVGINQSKQKKQSILDLPEKLFVNKLVNDDHSNFFDKNNLDSNLFDLYDS